MNEVEAIGLFLMVLGGSILVALIAGSAYNRVSNKEKDDDR